MPRTVTSSVLSLLLAGLVVTATWLPTLGLPSNAGADVPAHVVLV